ncbi:phosphoinositide 3-kinase adapter protein 1 isoform X2 [Platichthys flesus]|uniref:phosphoinositide 3-kinase adapter protein 1 isoform X2 n=1 Tax=Platichthys flesus TaxID=8260 RepID=UPI002DBAE222|nr:phosphoinositide 3-kinase adapter protein 1 isoform X2 [Platichthys flesus]
MEETVSCIELANSNSPSAYEVVILHTAEAQEWAAYLRQILKSSGKLSKRSILLHAVGPTDQLHGYDFEHFGSCKSIVLLLTMEFLAMLCEADLQVALHRLLHPPHRVVVLLCGIEEEHIETERFDGWHSWRKISSEDDSDVYVSTILEAVADSRHVEAAHESETAAAPELHVAAAPSSEIPIEKEEVVSEERKETVLNDADPDEEEPASTGNSPSEEVSAPSQLTCVTVQPSRVLCGEMLFIIFSQKLDPQLTPVVEFSSESEAANSLKGLVENEYTISVAAPAMAAGVVSLAMYIDGARVSLKPVTYYTSMGEVSRFLEKAVDPVSFICQAFNLTSNATQSLDDMLTDSFKSRMPATGFQLFGIRQIEVDNMAAYQRNEELPTLLHFAAKYGLKKLTTLLLQCPGALQAYSVMNKHGDYPNKLAEKSGFLDLRQFMDEFVVTADMVKSHFEDQEEAADVYEPMTTTSREIMMKFSGCSEDIYESMLGIDPECADDLYEDMSVANESPEEAMLRKFFQAKPQDIVSQDDKEQPQSEDEPKDNPYDLELTEEEEEDPYNLFPEDIYDIVDSNSTLIPLIQNRPPAPVPRSEAEPEPEETMNYITRVFSDKGTSQSKTLDMGYSAVRPVTEAPLPVYDPYAGMKTPGQRQLISLQERVKVGQITVDEAVQEFKSWQVDHERRANSIRYQQENLKKLRDSITRRHKEREKTGKDLDYEISAPLQRNLFWGSSAALECAVYEPVPRMEAPPPPAPNTIQRGSWKTGSTSSTSSNESNRLSIQSCSSGSTEPEVEDTIENLPPPLTRPLRPSDAAPIMPPPRIPPRIPERVPENMLHERYISCPTRALPQRPPPREMIAPPVPRRLR